MPINLRKHLMERCPSSMLVNKTIEVPDKLTALSVHEVAADRHRYYTIVLRPVSIGALLAGAEPSAEGSNLDPSLNLGDSYLAEAGVHILVSAQFYYIVVICKKKREERFRECRKRPA